MNKAPLGFLSLFFAGLAHADAGVGLKLGTLGIGLDVTQPVTENVNIRGNVNFYDWNRSLNKSDIDYDAKLKLRTFGVLADWHPWQNGLRLSAGAYINGNKFNLKAKPGAGSTVNLNGTTYTLSPSDLSLDGNVKFDGVAPYIGIGWGVGSPKVNTWSLTAELGLLYQGTPRVSLRATCGPNLQAAGQCGTVEANRAAEESNLRDDLKDYRWYPVGSIGLMYSF